MAVVSGSMGVNANQICIGDGTRGDIGCPDYAPSVTTAGLEVSGTVSATRFVGDGSALTGMATNIISGSAYVKAQQDTGALVSGSLTVSGTVIAINITIAGTVQLGVHGSQPAACSASYRGMLAMSNSAGMCFCNGTVWQKSTTQPPYATGRTSGSHLCHEEEPAGHSLE